MRRARAATGRGSSCSTAKSRTAPVLPTRSDVTVGRETFSPVSSVRLRDGNPRWTLTIRLAAVCTSKQRVAVRHEARAVVDWALAYVDPKVLDEAVGRAELAQVKPRRPRAIAVGVRERALEHGIVMPEFWPKEG